MTRIASRQARPGGRPPAPEPLPLPVTDSHCHLDMALEASDPLSAAEALAAATAVGVTRIVQIGCDREGARWAVDCAETHDSVVAGVALHPNEAPRLAAAGVLDAALGEIDELAAHPRVRAVGETGLDFFRTPPEGRPAQEESFRAHIAMAKAHDRTLVVHDRDAHADVLRVLTQEGAPERTVLHCFSGDADFARRCADLGAFLSFAGTLTFANAAGLRQALAAVPPEQVLVETDAPFLTPVPYRGRPNASYLIPLTVRMMAQVRDVPVDRVCRDIASATERAFGAW